MGSRASGEERSQKLDMDMEIRYVDHSEVRTTCDSTRMCYLQDISTDPARYNVVDYSEGANERDTK